MGTHLAIPEVGRDIGSASGRGAVRGGVLRVVEGQVSHLQAVGHDCGMIQTERETDF